MKTEARGIINAQVVPVDGNGERVLQSEKAVAWIHEYGLTKREYFAAKAMEGLLAGRLDSSDILFEQYASTSVRIADQLIEALNKQEESK